MGGKMLSKTTYGSLTSFCNVRVVLTPGQFYLKLFLWFIIDSDQLTLVLIASTRERKYQELSVTSCYHLLCMPTFFLRNEAELSTNIFWRNSNFITIAGAPWQMATIKQSRDWEGPRWHSKVKKSNLELEGTKSRVAT